MRKNGSTKFDDSFSKGFWSGEYLGNLSTPHLKRIYHYCLDFDEKDKAEEIKEELEKRGVNTRL